MASFDHSPQTDVYKGDHHKTAQLAKILVDELHYRLYSFDSCDAVHNQSASLKKKRKRARLICC